jgi:hypothetical protein
MDKTDWLDEKLSLLPEGVIKNVADKAEKIINSFGIDVLGGCIEKDDGSWNKDNVVELYIKTNKEFHMSLLRELDKIRPKEIKLVLSPDVYNTPAYMITTRIAKMWLNETDVEDEYENER